MDFGIMFFSSAEKTRHDNLYQLLLDAARFADANDFCCVWTPERHFHPFGGMFPNPALTSAALAMITNKTQIRAGSLIAPLHDTVRIVEEWSVVDNLSGGRVAVAFGSGWNADDFLFFPDRYEVRQGVMFQQIEEVQRLWAGGTVSRRNGAGKDVTVSLYPRPRQPRLPIWVTSSGNRETFASAGRLGANILTHLIGQDLATLSEKIRVYRDARREAGHDPAAGIVSLMLHTYMGDDLETVRQVVHQPFREYLRSAVNLEARAAKGGGAISGGLKIESHDIPDDVMEDLLEATFERYFHTAALMGTPASCRELVWQLRRAGVNEIACLIDFGVPVEGALKSLEYVAGLRDAFSAEALADTTRETVSTFMEDLEE